MAHNDQLGLRTDGCADLIEVSAFDGVCGDFCDAHAGIFKIGQRTGNGVMLYLTGDHVIARLQHALKTQVDSIGRVERKDDAIRVSNVKQLGQNRARFRHIGGSQT